MKVLKWIAVFLGILILLGGIDYGLNTVVEAEDYEDSTLVDEVVFPHDEVIDVMITIEEDDLAYMNSNAMAEEVLLADITYNGYTFQDVGIRTKGNSSLRDVANSDSDRYSFKIDFNYYISGQNLLGITKLNLNNLFSDPTMMAEYTGYEALDSIGADASRTTYVALYINDAYFGLYLSVEQVNETFLEEHFEDSDGELYKPDMGVGSDLAYISDDIEDYTGIFSETSDDNNGEAFIDLVTALDTGEGVEEVLNIDSFLSYLAMSSLTIHLDTYQKGMYHNYYLYNNDGQFEWISWDLNMIYNGFPTITDSAAMDFIIDEPVAGDMSNYPLVEAVLDDEDNLNLYHEYISQLLDGYYQEDIFEARVLEIFDMIKDYVQTDPTSFYTYEGFETALFEDDGENMSLLSFMKTRSENVQAQLDGTIASTNDGMGNEITSGMGGNRGNDNEAVDAQADDAAGDRPVGDEASVDIPVRDEASVDRPEKGQRTMASADDGMIIDLEAMLPEGMTMEDVPESIRTAIENDEMPDMNEVKIFMDELGVDPMTIMAGDPMISMAGENVRSGEIPNEAGAAVIDSTGMMIQLGLLAIFALTMIVASRRLAKA